MIDIICFHGCGQDSQIFSSLLKNLQNNCKNHNWIYVNGSFAKKGGGYGWYKYKDNNQNEIINSCYSDICNKIVNPENTILIGFSEGGQFVLDIAQLFPDIKGVLSISPSYSNNLPKTKIYCPVVFVYSTIEDKYIKKSVSKWKKLTVGTVKEIQHNKGHKIYIPLETRTIIKNTLNI